MNYNIVKNKCYSIDKKHYFFLETFCCVSKLPAIVLRKKRGKIRRGKRGSGNDDKKKEEEEEKWKR